MGGGIPDVGACRRVDPLLERVADCVHNVKIGRGAVVNGGRVIRFRALWMLARLERREQTPIERDELGQISKERICHIHTMSSVNNVRVKQRRAKDLGECYAMNAMTLVRFTHDSPFLLHRESPSHARTLLPCAPAQR